MNAIGLAIMIVAGVVTVDVVLENTRNTEASVVGQTVANVDLGGFFTAGVLVGVAFMLGLMLLLAGLRRARRKRLERKELARSYEGTAAHAETLQDERDRLAAELESERRARASERGGQGNGLDHHGFDHDHDHRHGEGHDAGHDHEAAPIATPAVPSATASPAGAPADTAARPANSAAVYPDEPAGAGAATAGPATATADHPKPSLRNRLLGR